MKASDRTIVMAVGLVLLAVAFYLLILGPKRQEAGELAEQISALEASIDEQENVAAFAEQARQRFPTYYGRLVVLGKAVPDQADTSSMLVQLNTIAQRKDVDFFGIELSQAATGAGTGAPAGGATAAASASTAPASGSAAPAAGTASDGAESETASSGEAAPSGEADSSSSASSTTPAPAATTTPAPATESAAANLPIGAVVGPAGLPTLPYELTFGGSFFEIADYFAGLDGLVRMREGSGQVSVDGRLMTIDGFGLKGGAPGASPELEATFAVTSYVTPAEQGLTAGASPGGPAPVAPPANAAQPETTPAAVTP